METQNGAITLKMNVFLKKLKLHLPYDLAIGVYPKVKKKKKSPHPYKPLNTDVHGFFICNS